MLGSPCQDPPPPPPQVQMELIGPEEEFVVRETAVNSAHHHCTNTQSVT